MYDMPDLFEFRQKIREVIGECDNIYKTHNFTIHEITTINLSISLVGAIMDTFVRNKKDI